MQLSSANGFLESSNMIHITSVIVFWTCMNFFFAFIFSKHTFFSVVFYHYPFICTNKLLGFLWEKKHLQSSNYSLKMIYFIETYAINMILLCKLDAILFRFDCKSSVAFLLRYQNSRKNNIFSVRLLNSFIHSLIHSGQFWIAIELLLCIFRNIYQVYLIFIVAIFAICINFFFPDDQRKISLE